MTRHSYLPCLVRVGAIFAAIGFTMAVPRAETIWLSSLDLTGAKVTDKVRPAADKTIDGKVLTINGQTYSRGVCVNGFTIFYVQLNGGSDRFSAVLGVDDESALSAQPPGGRAEVAGRAGAVQGGSGRGGAAPSSMSVRILVDENKVLYENNAITIGGNGVPIEVDTKGVKLMALIVNNGAGARGGRGVAGAVSVSAHYDLAEARFEVSGPKPAVVEIPGEDREVLTPKPGPKPRINGPALTGVTAGRPVLYKIPVTGTRPITYAVDKLPPG